MCAASKGLRRGFSSDSGKIASLDSFVGCVTIVLRKFSRYDCTPGGQGCQFYCSQMMPRETGCINRTLFGRQARTGQAVHPFGWQIVHPKFGRKGRTQDNSKAPCADRSTPVYSDSPCIRELQVPPQAPG